ncbi:DUF4097 family beta strand repeat-containing protein [Aerococcaceae bacterium NML160702]|nr:DUF4097 family beta strand repeat-containing protein [Aerococcaceae bacterium NML160702]
MNEKERIIELVRQNIITMDEALKLLEAAGQAQQSAPSDASATNSQEQAVEEAPSAKTDFSAMVDEVVTSASSLVDEAMTWVKSATESTKDTESELTEEESTTSERSTAEQLEQSAEELAEVAARLSAELDEQQANKQKKEEALVIARQRYRELEILAELDELSEEMRDQQERLTLKIAELEQEIQGIEEAIQETKADQKVLFKSQVNQYKEDVKQFVNEAAENAAHFGSQAGRHGRKWSQLVTKGMKNFLESIGTKEMNVTVNVPWVKSAKLDHTFVYPATEISILDLSTFNGDLSLETHDADTIEIDSEITFIGKTESISIDVFEEVATVSTDGDRLIFHVNTPRISIDATIRLPRKMYDHIKVVSLNGDISLKEIEAKDLYIEAKNGDVELEQVNAVMAELDLIHGDVKMKNVAVRDVVTKNVNGDFRMKGNIENVSVEAINGDVYLTKGDLSAANIRTQLVNGDIKVALPKGLNLEAECDTVFGELHHRLSDLDEAIRTKRQVVYRRLVSSDAPQVTVHASTKTGDIYMKDSE